MRPHQPDPAMLRLLDHARHVLREKKPRSRERLGLAPDQLTISRSVAVALDHARARITATLALRSVARERYEGSVEVHERARIGRAPAEAPGGVSRQRGEELQAPDAAELVAVDVHLGDTREERPAEPRRLERDDALRPLRAEIDAVRFLGDPRPAHARDRRSAHAIHGDEHAGVEARIRARRRLAPVAHPLDQPGQERAQRGVKSRGLPRYATTVSDGAGAAGGVTTKCCPP